MKCSRLFNIAVRIGIQASPISLPPLVRIQPPQQDIVLFNFKKEMSYGSECN